MPTNHRLERVAEEIKKQLTDLIRDEVRNPAIPTQMVSIISIDVTKDFKHAKVYVSIFGDDEVQAQAIKALRQTAGFLRFELGKRLSIHTIPEVHFELDQSILQSVNISRILKEMEKPHDQPDNRPSSE